MKMDKFELNNSSSASHVQGNEVAVGYQLDSPTPSMRTVSSTNSIREMVNRSGSTFDIDHRHDQSRDFSTTNGNVFVVNAGENAASATSTRVAINNSTDSHIGNKIFYNGPVTIKQFLIGDKHVKQSQPAEETVDDVVNGGSRGKIR